ncbi:MAG: SusC/RagA family TonB-linked outer membrane protein [Cyclobacteriaceae bacterium]
MKIELKKLFFLIVFTGTLGVLSAQAQSVSGTVTDAEDGSAIPGVNIFVKGSSTGTVTDIEGGYQIEAGEEDVLVFSFVGYTTEEIEVGNQSVIDVGLEPDITELTEVVVVGYGQQQKKDVTGVVEKVDAKEFNQGPIVSPDQLISGKVAGVQITPNSGEPGGQASIRIRGGTSINASNEPLFVIDGVPIQNDPFSPGGFSTGRNPLNFLNPDDIESMTVLKDASAAAIYGARAANGVIIITTKRASKNQEGRLSYSGNFSVSERVGRFQILDAEAFRNVVTAKAPQNLEQLGNENTNWLDAVTRTATGQNHNLSYSGGSENTGYRVSLGYQQLEGVIKASNTERLSLGLNLNSSLLDDNLTYNISFKGAQTNDRFSPGVIGDAASFDPTQPIFNPGSDSTGGYFEFVNDQIAVKNPVSKINQTEEFGKTFRGIGSVDMEYKFPFLEGFSAQVVAGFDITNGQRESFNPNTLESQRVGDNGELRGENMIRQNTLLDFMLKYNTYLDNLQSQIDFTLGYSYQDFNGQFRGSRSWDLETNIFGRFSADPASEHLSFLNIEENRIISFFGRLNYSLKDRYILTATLRRDGSTRFGDLNKWGLFPSVAVGWRVLEEPFASPLQNIFTDLKLRLSYGVNGNQEIGNYLYLPTYSLSNTRARYQFGDQFISVLRPNAYDAGLKWEETTSYNAGIDFGILNGRLYGSVEYYYKQTNDLLFEVGVPVGANLRNLVLSNIGSLFNEGVELSLNGIIVDNADWNWNLSGNIAYNNNQILKLDNNIDPDFEGYLVGGISGGTGNNIQILREGQPVNSFYVYTHKMDENGNPRVDGIDYNEDGEINLADLYEDTNNDGIVNDKDRDPYKRPDPDIIFGITSNASYRNFDLAFTFRGNIGNYIYNNNESNFGNYDRLTANTANNIHASALLYGFQNPQFFSDIYVQDGSYLLLDNITLGYRLSQVSGANIRFFGTVQNAFNFTNYRGLDPIMDNGIDNNIYPRSRTYLLGLSVGF